MKRVIIALMFLSIAVVANAEVPNEITYQGRLREYGQPVTGTKTMNFKIYNAETGPGLQWETGNVSVSVSSGVFTYTLTPNVDWRSKDLWVETVVSGKTLQPREKLTAQAFALHAATAEGLSQDDGSEISFTVGNNTRAKINTTGELVNLVNGTTFYMVPRGAIIMWSGLITNIPQGWALCDGSNGTPDLRDRFIMGIGGGGNSGDVGGSLSHNHTFNDLTDANTGTVENHQHAENIFSEIGCGGAGLYVPWRHGGTMWGSVLVEGTNSMTATAGFSSGGRSVDSAYAILTSPNGSHSHTMNHGHSMNSTTTLPPYCKLAFIMKL